MTRTVEKPGSRIVRNDTKRGGRATWNGDRVAAHRVGLPLDQRRVQRKVSRIVLFGTIDDLKLVAV